MALKEKASKAWNELKQKLQDKENQKRVRLEIERRLKQGKDAIDRLERDLRDPETQARMENKLRDLKGRVVKAKKSFVEKKKQAVAYSRKNPEKALLIAAAAGALAGALWVTVNRKKRQ
jgi:ElaB/YqjD/DUF883 family membrane-anchored ribosome-binding protein